MDKHQARAAYVRGATDYFSEMARLRTSVSFSVHLHNREIELYLESGGQTVARVVMDYVIADSVLDPLVLGREVAEGMAVKLWHGGGP